MEIIDAQVHILPSGAPAPSRGGSRPIKLLHVDMDQMMAEMVAVGVTRALVTGQVSRLGDNAYLRRAAEEHPDKFAAIGTIDPAWPDIEERIRGWRSQSHLLGIRIVILSDPQIAQWRSGAFGTIFAAAERHGVPVFIYAPRVMHEVASMIRSHADLQIVLDHLSLPQPSAFDDRDPHPFQRLPELLRLAAFDNVAIKLTGAPTLSMTSYPFPDLWPSLHQMIAAFGVDRVMWGSDWTRISEICSYAESVGYVRDTPELSEVEKEKVMGGTLRRLLRWP